MDLKNLKIEDLKPLILQYADKKTLIKIGISVGAVLFFFNYILCNFESHC